MAAFLDLSVLREGQLGRVVLAYFASMTGDFLVIAAVPAAVVAVDGQLGLTFAVQAFALAVFFVVGGVLGDRHSRRKIVIASDLLRFGSQAVVAILLIRGDAEYWQLLAAQAAHGAGAGLFLPAMSGLVPEVVADSRLQEANALRGVSSSLGAIAGPAIAAVIFATSTNPGWAFAADAVTFLISAQLLTRLRVPDYVRGAASSFVADVIEGWSEFRQMTWLWVVVAEFALLNTVVVVPFFAIGPVVAEESLGGLGGWAVVLAAMGVGELVGGFVAKVWRPARPLLAATLVIGLWALPLLLLAALAPIALLAAAAALGGCALAVFGALWETAVQSVPRSLRSRLSSYDFLGSRGLVAPGFFLAGLAQERIGSQPSLVFALGILIMTVSIVATVPSVSKFRRGDATDGGKETAKQNGREDMHRLREVVLTGGSR